MKKKTRMTYIFIVILALLVGIGTWLFSSNGPARQWINDFFNNEVTDIQSGDTTGPRS